MKKITVIELFAGVGGFRIGLDNSSKKSKNIKYETIWSSQWEPGASIQYASEIYKYNFNTKSDEHSCEDIQEIVEKKFNQIPNHDLLVGGFPCQDYSVARTANQAKGIYGKKGVLWWSIFNILKKKGKNAPDFLMLENVDRLLKSPSAQRGRDFAVMLSSLAYLGYAVEWRVINAADYGMPQRRRRTYIMGYKKGTKLYNIIKDEKDIKNLIYKNGLIAKAFPIKKEFIVSDKIGNLEKDLEKVSKNFSAYKPKISPFQNSGVMFNYKVYTAKTLPEYNGKYTVLNDVIIKKNELPIKPEFYIKEEDKGKWIKLKGAKNEKRKTKDGFEYNYSEGSMAFPDSLLKPSRTIVTGEGGSSPSRFKHVIEIQKGKWRRLMPLELERLNMFPKDHTKFMQDGKEVPDTKRAFIMGNALVVGVIEKLGKALLKSQ